jgi:hypothetical protein
MMEQGKQIEAENYFNLTYPNDQPLEMNDIDRWKANLIGNIDDAIEKLRNTHLTGDNLNKLFNNF